jgi:hypothetical protein
MSGIRMGRTTVAMATTTALCMAAETVDPLVLHAATTTGEGLHRLILPGNRNGARTTGVLLLLQMAMACLRHQ